MKKKRPLSISIIAWLIIILFGFVGFPALLSILIDPEARRRQLELLIESPLPLPVHYFIIYVGMLGYTIAGVAILKGKNWGRWFLVICGGVGLTTSLISTDDKYFLVPHFVVYFFVVASLFRPQVTYYFRKKEPDEYLET